MLRFAPVVFVAFVVALLWASSPAAGQSLRARRVATGLVQPVGVSAPPGDLNRLFIIEQNGRLRILDLTTGVLLGAAYLDVTALVTFGGEQGLLGLAFHPNFATNGFFYVNYTRAGDGASIIARYTANAPFATSTSANAGSALIMYTIAQPFANHNGGHLAFGPDGMLYASFGDGGSGNDPGNRSQNDGLLLGKMLRLDVNDNSAVDGDALYIPNNNPHRGAGNPLDEIWAKGLRNPWKFSFDRLTGDMYIGDVGQDAMEEIDFQPAVILSNPTDGNSTITNAATVAGRNYGWRCMEGTLCTGLSGCTCNAATLTPPLLGINQSTGFCSITGGVVYRGSAIPLLQGAYFYTDYCLDQIRSLRVVGGAPTDLRDWSSQLIPPTGAITDVVAFGEDGAGEMYIVSILGSVFKVLNNDVPCGCPCVLTGADTQVLAYNFQTLAGWASSTPPSGASTDGFWTRGIPVNSVNYGFDPTGDSDGSGQCWITDNTDPGFGTTADVDGGSSWLNSPALDFLGAGGGNLGGDITICYDYFLNMDSVGVQDGLFVEISSNGTTGPYVRVASHTVEQGGRWTPHAITQAQLTSAGVVSTANMRLRFIATDGGADNIVEAGLDNVKIYRRIPITDCNNNGIPDATDIANATSQDCNANLIPDECDLASGNFEDFDGGPVGIRLAGGTFFNTSCIGCHAPNGTGGTGPNIRNKSRTQIRNRLLLIVPHPGGGFGSATDQDFANLEAFLADGGSRGRPDRIPDVCQNNLPNCNATGGNDGKELALGTQVDLDYDGLPDDCECASNTSPAITLQPVGGRFDPGSSVTLTVSATTVIDGSLTYAWRKDMVPLSDGGAISGSATAALSISPAQFPDSGNYTAVVTDSCGNATSNPAFLGIRCVADVDDGTASGVPDGGVTIEDLLYYLFLFENGDVRADVDDGSGTGTPDGGLTIDDLLYYLFRFENGC